MITYWLILYEPYKDKHFAPSPIKIKTTRANYEIASRMERATVNCEKGKFLIVEKKIFTLELEQMCFLIADVERKK